MANVQIIVPEVGESGMDLTFVQWVVEVGARVSEGDDLFELDTDKTTMLIEAFESGTLREVSVQAGDPVQARQVIGILETT